jgi:hypothetical protein
MAHDPLSTREKVHQLRDSLGTHFQRPAYARCESMGELVKENLESIRLNLGRTFKLPEIVPE